MKSFKLSSLILPILFLTVTFICEAQNSKNEKSFTQISKIEVINWLQKNKTKKTPLGNKFIDDILQNALFNEMYFEKTSNKGKVLIVPLKQSYFSQHINKNKPLPFQSLIVDIDNYDKIFTMVVNFIYPADKSLKILPPLVYNKFYTQNSPLDGTYIFVSILPGDFKYIEIDVKNNERSMTKQWMSKKIEKNLYGWSLETTDIANYKFGTDIKLNMTSKELGTSKTVSPPMFKGDLRSED